LPLEGSSRRVLVKVQTQPVITAKTTEADIHRAKKTHLQTRTRKKNGMPIGSRRMTGMVNHRNERHLMKRMGTTVSSSSRANAT
jgi:hypothetical protein